MGRKDHSSYGMYQNLKVLYFELSKRELSKTEVSFDAPEYTHHSSCVREKATERESIYVYIIQITKSVFAVVKSDR